jgi:hypothetical protein
MSNDKQTAVDWLFKETLGITLQLTNKRISHRNWELEMVKLLEQAKEMEKERMRSYIEEKWKQYRIVTNEEDAWLFKEWLIEQTYGGNK